MKPIALSLKKFILIVIILSTMVGLIFGYNIGHYYNNGGDEVVIPISISSGWNRLSSYQISRYNRSNFNCLDMSTQWKEIFEILGLNATVMCGFRNGSGHAWVNVRFPNGDVCEFESTLAIFKNVSYRWSEIITLEELKRK
jgi:hypothetical protein